MKNNLTVLIFAIFTVLFTSVSYAKNHYLYVINQSSKNGGYLTACPQDPISGQINFNYCRSVDIESESPFINAITITRSGNFAYIVASDGVLEVCSINDAYGNLTKCKYTHDYQDQKAIQGIVRMITDTKGLRLYYITKSALGQCRLDPDSGMYSYCKIIKNNLLEPTSLAFLNIPPVIYLTLRETSSILACPFKLDGTKELGDCNNNRDPNEEFISPNAIAINRYSTKYAYIVDGQSPAGVAKSCWIDGKSLEGCNSLVPGGMPYNSGATDIALSSVDYYAYISFPEKKAIVSCKINEGQYSDCQSNTIITGSPLNIAYR